MTRCWGFTVRWLVGVPLAALLFASALSATSSAAPGRNQRAWLSFDYKGNTVQNQANDLGFIQTAQGSGGYGTEEVQNDWLIGIKIRVVIQDRQGKHPQITDVIGQPIITSVKGGGTVSKEPTAGCQDAFGSLCPQPGSPVFRLSCSVHITANPAYFDPPHPGYPLTSIPAEPKGFLNITMYVPGAAAFTSPAGGKCRGPTDLDNVGLENFVPPTQFGDAPAPVTNPKKLAQYQRFKLPKLDIGAKQVHRGLAVLLHGLPTFDVNWAWQAGQAKKQIGKDVTDSIDAESEFTNFKLTP